MSHETNKMAELVSKPGNWEVRKLNKGGGGRHGRFFIGVPVMMKKVGDERKTRFAIINETIITKCKLLESMAHSL